MAEVILKDITKIFDKDVVAVNDINLEIKDQEFVVLVGPSGCGKSTTLRMIAGLEVISKGELYIDGKKVNDVPPKDRNISMVFQNYALYPHMSVFENMAFGLKLRKYSKDEIKNRVQEAAEILGITNLLDRKPKMLSGGQRQRVAVGRAIVRHPKVFLFDEPLSNLDAKLRVQMRTEISKLHRELNATMVYVTHDQVEAMTMGDRIVVMKDGDVMQIDTPLNLYNYPQNKFVAGFIGSPAMNFLDGRIVRDNGLYFDEGNLRINLSEKHEKNLFDYVNKKVAFGIRPEHVYFSNSSREEDTVATASLKVEVIEPMGNETFLYMTIGGHQVVVRTSAHSEVKVGEPVDLIFDLEKAHFFDLETEEAII